MRGRIVFIHPATETGVIFGANRTRYRFSIAEWQGKAIPPRNLEIEFTPVEGEARAIQPFKGLEEVAAEEISPTDRHEDDEAIDATPKPLGAASASAGAAQGQASAVPVMLADRRGQAAAASPAFAAAVREEEDEAVPPLRPEPAPLRAGRPGPASAAAPLGSMLFAEGAASCRPTWIYYLIGIGVAAALILIAYIAVRFL